MALVPKGGQRSHARLKRGRGKNSPFPIAEENDQGFKKFFITGEARDGAGPRQTVSARANVKNVTSNRPCFLDGGRESLRFRGGKGILDSAVSLSWGDRESTKQLAS